MLGQGCGKRVLARGPCAEVTRCTCGHIHLALGPVTIRVEEEVLRAIGLTMAEALQNLDEPEQGHAEGSDSESMPSLLGGWKQ
ncbi:hypothetical protein HUA76_17500 [Myxococcus sp. CA056]|uniref:hypothetical protein n=1 Tax=unclassified Myxococcus TaxID=2648731 RepID=UPI00157A339C|nr:MULTISPECIES: hypothetical protein [unclassified Myxococcus]NTX12594.1 hypothetical protein [Myxococcus sp. CA056]NTX33613.1 hypothetical protein [Myxococcus sp. CA033]NTX53469.1 hypothetical protein [Myxococcus sp. CA039A]